MAVPGTPVFTITPVGVGQLTLSWTTVATATGYRIYRSSDDTDGNYVLYKDDDEITELMVTYADGVYGNGATKYYKMSATNLEGESVLSTEKHYTTWPNRPTNVAVTATGIGELTLSWTAQPTATGYRIYRSSDNTDGNYVLHIASTILTTGSTSYVDGTYANNATKWYRMTSTNDEIGESEPTSGYSGLTWNYPAAPVLSSATGGLGKITLIWTAPTDGGTAITGYSIYSGTAGVFTTLVDTVDDLILTYDATVGAGLTRYYKVSAENAVDESNLSNEASGTTFYIPGAPTMLSSIDADKEAILSWTPPVISSGNDAVDYYIVYQDGVDVKHVNAPAVATSITGLVNGTEYAFKVSAVNAAGEGAKSNENKARPEVSVSVAANQNMVANGAINIAIYNLSGAYSWTILIPPRKKILGITANFSTTDNIGSALNIVTTINAVDVAGNQSGKVEVLDGGLNNLYDVTAFVYYK